MLTLSLATIILRLAALPWPSRLAFYTLLCEAGLLSCYDVQRLVAWHVRDLEAAYN